MRCLILVSEKMGSFPLFECGGIMLAAGEELLVKEEWGKSIMERYKSRFACAGHIEKDSLRNGHYEVRGKPKNQPPGIPEQSSVEQVSENRSMVGKHKVRRK